MSNFVKIHLPKILQDLIHNKRPSDIFASPIRNKKAGGNSFLPPLNKRGRNPYEIDGSFMHEQEQVMSEAENPMNNVVAEHWMS